MIYFSGFSLAGEAELFDEFLADVRENPYTVAGFSYGAQRALEYVVGRTERVDRLLLLSPAWFLDKKRAFIRLQCAAYRKDREAYLKRFLAAAASPSHFDLHPYLSPGGVNELETLLGYPWPEEALRTVRDRGIAVEVYLGAQDRIVDASEAFGFFKRYATAYLFKEYGHLLR